MIYKRGDGDVSEFIQVRDGEDKTRNAVNRPVLVRVGQREWWIGEDDDRCEPDLKSSVNGDGHETKVPLQLLSLSKHPVRNDGNGIVAWLQYVIKTCELKIWNSVLWVKASHRLESFLRFNTNLRKQDSRSTSLEIYQVGAITGLFLGCIAMIMFHQIQPAELRASQKPTSHVQTTNTGLAIGTIDGPAITIPYISIDTLELGTFASRSEVIHAKNKMLRFGVHAAVIHGHTFQIIVGSALFDSGLSGLAKGLRAHGEAYHMVRLHHEAALVPTLQSCTLAQSDQINKWLSAETSAADAIVAATVDGGNIRDAETVHAMSLHLQPTSNVLSQTGHDRLFERTVTDINEAFIDNQKHNPALASEDITDFYATLLEIDDLSVKNL